MNNEDNIALVDLDGTVCDHDGALLRDLQSLHSPDEPPIDMTVWRDKTKMPPHISARTNMIRSCSGWWENLPVIEKGMALVKIIQEIGYRIVILTQGPRQNPSAWKGKVKWVYNHFPDDTDIVITRDKGLVYGKVLFDDYPPYLQTWLEHRPRGLAIMNSFQYNEGFNHPNVLRYDTEYPSDKIIEALKRQFERKPLENLQMSAETHCPYCGGKLLFDTLVPNGFGEGHFYCPVCEYTK